MTHALSLSSISYTVAGLEILKTLDLKVETAHYYAIAGVNGAGKSTLIKLILDLIRPASGGSIRIFKSDNQDQKCRSQLAYLPEKFDVKKILLVGSIWNLSQQFIICVCSQARATIFQHALIFHPIDSIHVSAATPREWYKSSVW